MLSLCTCAVHFKLCQPTSAFSDAVSFCFFFLFFFLLAVACWLAFPPCCLPFVSLPKLIESKDTRCALAEALLLRYLERIGDHAVFMSDAINYIVTGKHRPSEERIASHTQTPKE